MTCEERSLSTVSKDYCFDYCFFYYILFCRFRLGVETEIGSKTIKMFKTRTKTTTQDWNIFFFKFYIENQPKPL